jgi:alpha-tubulin suppressor-like RCC1 family protein
MDTLWAWGSGSVGRLGQNDTTKFSSPVQIPGTTWSSISAGNNIH